MAIQNINLGALPLGTGGDTFRSAATKINENFSNTTHAASKLVGTASGQIPLAQNTGTAAFGHYKDTVNTSVSANDLDYGIYFMNAGATDMPFLYSHIINLVGHASRKTQLAYPYGAFGANSLCMRSSINSTTWSPWVKFYNTGNTTQDGNGFIKGASPIVRVFSDKVEFNDDAQKQNIEYVKNGVGDYLIKNSSGLSNDGWYIETPKDANGNVLVAVVYKQLENGDISIKTYAKKFDEETGDIIPNLTRPRDIPETRWIDLRLNELPTEEVTPTKEV